MLLDAYTENNIFLMWRQQVALPLCRITISDGFSINYLIIFFFHVVYFFSCYFLLYPTSFFFSLMKFFFEERMRITSANFIKVITTV
jgi:hypothetical protein